MARCSDFIVQEIQPDGQLVKLEVDDLTYIRPLPANETPIVSSEESTKRLTQLLTKAVFDKIETKLKEDNKEWKITSASAINRNERKDIHHLLRSVFSSTVSSSTNPDGFIEMTPATKKSKDRRRPVARRGNFTHFNLFKMQFDTMDCVSRIGGLLRVQPKAFAFAGTKDRRSASIQRISVAGIEPGRLMGINKSFHNRILVGNISSQETGIFLGDLSGNAFTILLRDVEGSEEGCHDAVASLKEHGFINYYGLQRFGRSGVKGTHTIGISILRSDWLSAINRVFACNDGHLPEELKARQVWQETHDPHKTIDLVPQRSKHMRDMLTALCAKSNGKNYRAAFKMLPRPMRLLYVHAYQSFIWNHVVSKRIAMGMEPIVGDLVLQPQQDEVEPEVAVIYDPEAPDVVPDVAKSRRTKAAQPKIKTLEAADLTKYTVFDVVMPTPGWKVTYPPATVSFYEELMAKDGLNPHAMQHSNDDFSLEGAYRHILVKPTAVEANFLRYTNPDDDILETLADKLEGRSLEEPSGLLTGFKISFQLPSASYATMALREVAQIKPFVYRS